MGALRSCGGSCSSLRRRRAAWALHQCAGTGTLPLRKGIQMSDADRAYAAAQAEIARVAETGETELRFEDERFRALDRLPPEIAELSGLQILDLGKTQIADLTPLMNLNQLLDLDLSLTQVTDLTPLEDLASLQVLSLRATQISDLTPLANLFDLQTLGLLQTEISDLTPIKGLVGLQQLLLQQTQISDLTPLAGLSELQLLYLRQTQISDLTPLKGLIRLRGLYLRQTMVSDLAPLASLAQLQGLDLRQTSVGDLRPICDLKNLKGLGFANSPASNANVELGRLSAIENFRDCARETLAYLKTLPPWPEPLRWEAPAVTPEGPAPEAPSPDDIPILLLTDEARVDLELSPPTAADLGDPIKERLYNAMPAAVDKLVRFGNRYPEVATYAEMLRDLLSADFAEADILGIHLQIAGLTDLRAADAQMPEAERMDPECMSALNAVLRLGPPVTMGHPHVDLFEARSIEYARARHPATVAEGERQVALGLSEAQALTTERLRDAARLAAAAGDSGRVAEFRTALSRNTVIFLSTVGGAVGDAALGHLPGLAVSHAAEFLWLHRDAIMAIAPSWGESGMAWAEYVLLRVRRHLDELRNHRGEE